MYIFFERGMLVRSGSFCDFGCFLEIFFIYLLGCAAAAAGPTRPFERAASIALHMLRLPARTRGDRALEPLLLVLVLPLLVLLGAAVAGLPLLLLLLPLLPLPTRSARPPLTAPPCVCAGTLFSGAGGGRGRRARTGTEVTGRKDWSALATGSISRLTETTTARSLPHI